MSFFFWKRMSSILIPRVIISLAQRALSSSTHTRHQVTTRAKSRHGRNETGKEDFTTPSNDPCIFRAKDNQLDAQGHTNKYVHGCVVLFAVKILLQIVILFVLFRYCVTQLAGLHKMQVVTLSVAVIFLRKSIRHHSMSANLPKGKGSNVFYRLFN